MAKYYKAIYSDSKTKIIVLAQKKIQPSSFFMFANTTFIWSSIIIHLTRFLFIHFKEEDNGIQYLITTED